MVGVPTYQAWPKNSDSTKKSEIALLDHPEIIENGKNDVEKIHVRPNRRGEVIPKELHTLQKWANKINSNSWHLADQTQILIFPVFPYSVFSGWSGNGNPDFWVPLESLGQAQSAGTLQMSVGSPVEPQYGKTGKLVFWL